MIHYFLEFEESIGKVWDRFLHKKVTKSHTQQSITLADISSSLTLFYHLLGGEKGKSLQATDKRHQIRKTRRPCQSARHPIHHHPHRRQRP